MLVAGVVVMLFEGVLALIWTLRMARRSRELSARLQSEQAQLKADLERLRSALAEMQVLWRPYRRLLRWLRHPLVIALLQSYARRRAAAR